jgi:predicted amino acid-binding ACT domain protein
MDDATRYVLTVMCIDRVGVVARVARAVEDLDGNIEELQQTVLQGYFVLTFMATFGGSPSAEAVAAHLAETGEDGEFVVSVLPRRESSLPPAAAGEPFVLTILGRDAPGILKKLTAYLADRRINLERLTSHSEGGNFLITGWLTIPPRSDIPGVRLDLAEILADREASVTLMHNDIFEATGRVDMA